MYLFYLFNSVLNNLLAYSLRITQPLVHLIEFYLIQTLSTFLFKTN